MQCLYCNSHIHPVPPNGLCPNCGAVLSSPTSPETSQGPVTVVIQQPQTAFAQPPQPGITCCPRCYSQSIRFKKRGFGWGWALLGLFLLPPFGILFGLIGKNDLRYTCNACSHRWKR